MVVCITLVKYQVRGSSRQGICISYEVSGMWMMLHVPHAMYDYKKDMDKYCIIELFGNQQLLAMKHLNENVTCFLVYNR